MRRGKFIGGRCIREVSAAVATTGSWKPEVTLG
jgi:hypothetical protein